MLNHYLFSPFEIILPGTPTTVQLSGIFFITTVPAPTITFSPISIFGIITALVPILLPFPITKRPDIFTFGEIST